MAIAAFVVIALLAGRIPLAIVAVVVVGAALLEWLLSKVRMADESGTTP
jgi:hypothetical protein